MSTLEFLHLIFGERASIGKREVAKVLGISESKINQHIANNDLEYLPKFKRMGKGKNAKYIFPLTRVAEFLDS